MRESMGKKSDKAKGRAREKDVADLFEAAGFLAWRPSNKAIRLPGGRVVSGSQDILETFDIIAINAGHPVHLIQVTQYNPTNKGGLASERRTKIEAVADNIPLDHLTASVWAFTPRKPWRVWRLQGVDEKGVAHWGRSRVLRPGVNPGGHRGAKTLEAWLNLSRSRPQGRDNESKE
jgi:hypothetical protein